MRKIVFAPMLAAILFFGSACNSNNTGKDDSKEVAEEKNEQKFDDNKQEDDREFAVEAASGGLMEVELGKLAQKNASSSKVKEFGQTMVNDHSKANEELKTLAATKNISLPPTPGGKHQDHINELTGKTGAEFDKAYIDMMVDDHEEDVKKFQQEAEKGKDPEIKAFAAGKVPTLTHHLEMAKAIKDSMKH